MVLPKFNGENSGKSNPIVNLASHATQDNALRDQIGLPSTSSELENGFPQTFRMNDLMNEIRNAEVQSNPMFSVPSSSMTVPAANWPNLYNMMERSPRTHQEAIWAEMNARRQHQRANFQQMYPQFGNITQEDFYSIDQMHYSNFEQHSYYPYPLQTHNHYQESRESDVTLQDQTKKSQRELKDLEELNKNNKSEKVKEEVKEKKKVFYFDGLGVEEAFHKPAPDVKWSKAENFYLFVTNHKRKLMDINLQVEKKFEFTKNNPYIDIDDPLSQGLQCSRECNFPQATLFYEAAVQKDETCVTGWQQLIICLRNDGRHPEAFYLIKKSLHLDQNYFSRVLYSIYIGEQYYYQGCQVILRWLNNHPDYCDIVPPYFGLEDQTSNIIEEEQLRELEKILIKAAQRSPHAPDYFVQSALSSLQEILRDYAKANDCRLYLLQSDPVMWKDCEIVIGMTLLRDNKPYNALNYFEKIRKSQPTPLLKSHCEHGLGLTYMFLKTYIIAGQCLLTGLRISKMKNKILWLHLLLCAELMKRDDLINLVNNRDFDKLCEEFDCQFNSTTRSVLRKIRKRSNPSPSLRIGKRKKI